MNRRGFLGAMGTSLAALELLANGQGGLASSAVASTAGGRVNPETHMAFGPLQQIDAGVLNVGYVEAGPPDGPPVLLLHGWPYDIHSFVDVMPALSQRGYRVIVPYLRGYGTTRFISSGTVRNGQQGALAVDIINLMDALKVERRASRASTGARGRPTSSRRSGPSAAEGWSP